MLFLLIIDKLSIWRSALWVIRVARVCVTNIFLQQSYIHTQTCYIMFVKIPTTFYLLRSDRLCREPNDQSFISYNIRTQLRVIVTIHRMPKCVIGLWTNQQQSLYIILNIYVIDLRYRRYIVLYKMVVLSYFAKGFPFWISQIYLYCNNTIA